MQTNEPFWHVSVGTPSTCYTFNMVNMSDIRAAFESIAPRYGISQAYLFGSYARAEQNDSSDVDLLVELAEPLGFKRAKLHDEIEEALGLPVDLVFGEAQLHPPVRENYLQDRVIVYG